MTHPTLRTLMQRWVEFEPIRCWSDDARWWIYHVALNESSHFINAQNPEPEQLMHLEFAIREAIAQKGRAVLLRKEPEDLWRGMVDASFGVNAQAAVALLEAYLNFLTWEQLTREAIA